MFKLLDVLRTQYVRLPRPLKTAIAPALRMLPFSVRFGRTYWMVRESIVRSQTDAQFVQQFQVSALRALLGRAFQHSRHFSSVLQTALGTPCDVELAKFTPAELPKLPVLTKLELIEAPENFLIAGPGSYDVRFTSGSSGRPSTQIYLDRDRSVREFAFVHHLWSRIGYKVGDGRAILRDYAGNIASIENTWQYDPVLGELWLSPFHLNEATMDQYLELLHRYRVRFLYGVPSAITLLARHAMLRGWQPPQSFLGVLCASETLFPDQLRLMSKCFLVPVIAHYGMTERVAIAGELVDRPGTYEFEPLYGIVELVDNAGKLVTVPGQTGRIVCTGLFSKAMALIRFDVGDRATLVRPATFENCYRLQVSGIQSRWNQEFVIGKNGEKIGVINLDRENYFGIIQEYQYAQSIPGVAVFRVVPNPRATREQIDAVLAEISDRVRGVVDFQLEIVPSIAVGLTGKRNYVDQKIATVDH